MVFTAGPADIIDVKLKKEGLFFENVTVVGNRFIFDTQGIALDYAKPIVFVGNKHLVAQAMDEKIHADTVFLFGDHPTDAEMCQDTNHEKVFRFGFLNEKDASDGSYNRYDYQYPEKGASLYESFTILKNEVENR